MYSCNSSSFLKKDCSCDIWFAEYWFKTQSQEIKEIYIHMFFSLFYTNSCMFLWCITTSSLTICSWCAMTYSQFGSNGGPGKFFKNAKGEGHCSLIKGEQKVFLCLTKEIRVLGPFCWEIVPPLTAMICDWYAQ